MKIVKKAKIFGNRQKISPTLQQAIFPPKSSWSRLPHPKKITYYSIQTYYYFPFQENGHIIVLTARKIFNVGIYSTQIFAQNFFPNFHIIFYATFYTTFIKYLHNFYSSLFIIFTLIFTGIFMIFGKFLCKFLLNFSPIFHTISTQFLLKFLHNFLRNTFDKFLGNFCTKLPFESLGLIESDWSVIKRQFLMKCLFLIL